MKISKIILFVFSFFILGFISANAASISGTATVQVVGAGAGVVDCSGSYSTCINGSQTYNITTPAENGGAVCSAVNGATQNCGTSCVGSWSSCSNGTQTYNITSPASGGGAVCSFADNATRTCGTNCVGSWSSCVNGTETYNITTPASNGGIACPAADNDTKACGTVCPAPLTKNVTVACDLNGNGDAAISGSVIRKQTKSDFPGCIFETPVTNSNSTYVSDNCKYPAGPMSGNLDATSCLISIGESSCAVPYSWKVTNPETVGASAVTESTGGKTLATGDVGNKSLTLSYGESTTLFLYNTGKELASKYVDAQLNNCTWNGSVCIATPPAGPKVDGAWTAWTSRSSTCPGSGTQTRSCIEPLNGGAPCAPDADGMATSRDYTNNLCPALNVSFTWKDKPLPTGQKITYNGKAKVIWTSENVDSCSCEYSDKAGVSGSCGGNENSPYVTPALKRDTKYTISCLGFYGASISDSVTIPVDKMNTTYIEQ